MSRAKFTVFKTEAIYILPYLENDNEVTDFYYSGSLSKCKEKALKALEESYKENKEKIINAKEKDL